MKIRIDYLTSSNARLRRVFVEREDLTNGLNAQKQNNIALKEEIGRLKYELDRMANAQSFYVEESVEPCRLCLLHQLQQVKPGETD